MKKKSEKNQVDNIKVFLRLRPLNQLEQSLGGQVCVTHTDTEIQIKLADEQSTMQAMTGEVKDNIHKFNFDKIFGPETSQQEVFNNIAMPIVEQVMDGFNGTLFAYGQTSSGKTHTMEGPDIFDQKMKGAIPRMFQAVFDLIEETTDNIEFGVKVGMFEIYNEKVCDLLDPDRQNLSIKEDKKKGIYVQDLLEIGVQDDEQMLEIMQQGSQNRHIGATRMNEKSSRSHSLFLLRINQKNVTTDETKSGKMFFVDLAGSEKISKTNATGDRLVEAQNINKSLSCLGNVIKALTSGSDSYVPYRDSKLTRILQESLGGNSKTSLILASSTCSYNDKEILSTCRFGNRAKNIKNKPKQNVQQSAQELKLMLDQALLKIDQLNQQVLYLENRGGNETEDGEQRKSIDQVAQEKETKKIQNQKLLKQHQTIKQLAEENEKLKRRVSSLEEEQLKLIDQLAEANDQLQERDDIWSNNFRKFQNKNLIELKKVEHLVLEKNKKMRDKFDEYYNVLHYIENLYLTQGNLDKELPEVIVNENQQEIEVVHKNIEKQTQKKIRMASVDEDETDEDSKELYDLIFMQKDSINNLTKQKLQLQLELEEQKKMFKQKTQGYKDKINQFTQMMQEKIEKNGDQVKKQNEVIGVYKNQITSYVEMIKKQEKFIEQKQYQIEDLQKNMEIQNEALKHDNAKDRLATIEKQIYKMIISSKKLKEDKKQQSDEVINKVKELNEKEGIIKKLNEQVIQQSTMIDNLKKVATSFNNSSNNQKQPSKRMRQSISNMKELNNIPSQKLRQSAMIELKQSDLSKMMQNIKEEEDENSTVRNTIIKKNVEQIQVVQSNNSKSNSNSNSDNDSDKQNDKESNQQFQRVKLKGKATVVNPISGGRKKNDNDGNVRTRQFKKMKTYVVGT